MRKITLINAAPKLLGEYSNGNYKVSIYDDGTKIRETFDENATEFIPDFSENVDITLTRKCSIGCSFCYDNSKVDGKHGNVNLDFLNNLHPFTEVALNGNDLDHPQLLELLRKLKAQKVIANITVHQKQFMNNLNLLRVLSDEKLLYGIGVSYSYPDNEFIREIQKFPNAVIHTIDGILKESDINFLANKGLKLLILGYKHRGRGVVYSTQNEMDIKGRQEFINKNIRRIREEFAVLSFDNLALEHLPAVREVVGSKWGEFYMGDDGKFTFYIDLVNETFAKNSCIDESFPIDGKNIDEMFNFIREKYK